ncbi:class I SAM-dependent methyltransferase [Paenibacillus sp. TRM 82003]|nr:class I SAM-dependent methyltransferase [Paenibacillus sp. TRM 82003]
MNNVANYYEMIDEASRFSRNSRKIEFLTTNYVLEQTLPPRAKILDVGAGTGVYSFHYAELQHEVVALDLTPKHVEVIKEESQRRGLKMEAYVGNAVDLSSIESGAFDAVFCFGPMYHLTNSVDRAQEYVDALGENEFESWLRYHFQTCRERSILGISTHGLYVCRKE